MKLTAFIPGITWFIISVVLLALPGNNLPQNNLFDIPYFDKWVHLIMFLLLTSLLCYPFFDWDVRNHVIVNSFNKVAVGVIIYGVMMEFVQKYFVVMRSFDVIDIVFDTIGSGTGLILVRNYYQKKIGPNRNRGRNQN